MEHMLHGGYTTRRELYSGLTLYQEVTSVGTCILLINGAHAGRGSGSFNASISVEIETRLKSDGSLKFSRDVFSGGDPHCSYFQNTEGLDEIHLRDKIGPNQGCFVVV